MADVLAGENSLQVVGQVDFDNADIIYQKGLNHLTLVKTWPCLIDLSQVQHGNTLLLAVILQWLKACPNMQSLKLIAVPEKMQRIIDASHLEELVSM